MNENKRRATAWWLVQISVAPAVLDPVEFARTRLRFDPDAKQEAVLRSGARRGLLNCTRQWGKSTVTAAKAVYHAHEHAGSLTLVLSPTARQSAEFLRKAAEFIGRLGQKVQRDGSNALSLAFPNGSRIVGLPDREENVRGFSNVSLMIIDEAARVRVTAEECPRIRKEFLREERAAMGTDTSGRSIFASLWTR